MSLDSSMATRDPQTLSIKPGETTTEFQLHKSLTCSDKSVIDYAERRLKWYALRVTDLTQRLMLERVISAYLKGDVAVAWKSGKPVYINVISESK